MAKVHFLPEDCACSGLIGSPRMTKVPSMALLKNINNKHTPLYKHSNKQKLGLPIVQLSPWSGPKAVVWTYPFLGLIWNNSPLCPLLPSSLQHCLECRASTLLTLRVGDILGCGGRGSLYTVGCFQHPWLYPLDASSTL